MLNVASKGHRGEMCDCFECSQSKQMYDSSACDQNRKTEESVEEETFLVSKIFEAAQEYQDIGPQLYTIALVRAMEAVKRASPAVLSKVAEMPLVAKIRMAPPQ